MADDDIFGWQSPLQLEDEEPQLVMMDPFKISAWDQDPVVQAFTAETFPAEEYEAAAQPIGESGAHNDDDKKEQPVQDASSSLLREQPRSQSPFPVNPRLNRMIALWEGGDPLVLGVDALVVPANERLDDDGMHARVHRLAGPELAAECARLAPCPLGDAVLTSAFDLPARFLVHAVGPRYSERFRLAAEEALLGAYRRSLDLVRERGLRSVALPELHPVRKGYPPQSAAHLACRSLRRWLEAHPKALDRVVLVLAEASPEIREAYRRVLPLYFPRTADEEALGAAWLPADVGTPPPGVAGGAGDSVSEDGDVDRSEQGDADDGEHKSPHHHHHDDNYDYGEEEKGDGPGPASSAAVGGEPVPAASAAVPVQRRRAPVRLGSKFAQAQEDPDQHRDRDRGRAGATKSRKQLRQEENAARYQAYLRRAREADLEDVAQRNFIYQSGVDGLGRPIICLVAGHVPVDSPASLERALLYTIRLLDPIVADQDFVLLYFHTQPPNQKRPPLSWLREVHGILDRQYKKRVKRIVILHPTLWVKTAIAFARLFLSSSKVWSKVSLVAKLMDLYRDFDPRQLAIPAHVLQHDMDLSPASYAAPAAANLANSSPSRP